jgi:dihydroxyacetone kinase-like protein
MSILTGKVVEIIAEIAKEIEANKQYLCDLDAAIGDGDHGFNMARGFEAAVRNLGEKVPETIGDALKTTAMALISNVGGASGPLYGTLFLRAGGVAKDFKVFNLSLFNECFKEGIAGVQARGKAVLGEKTMIDVLIPVMESLEKSSAEGALCKKAFETAVSVAQECAEKTKEIKATKGRASYLGDRSIGHIDPGAMSSCLIIRTIYNSIT